MRRLELHVAVASGSGTHKNGILHSAAVCSV